MTTSPTGRVRMSPDGRREQLLELGVRLLSTRSLDELSIETLAEEAGISRGLLYHYFGNEDLQAIYDEARAALTDRIFDVADQDGVLDVFTLEDTPAVRLMVRGWSALAEDVVISWVRDDRGVSRADLLTMLAAALPGVLSGAP
jgi:AcrR family transcriptional regulator